MIVIIGGGLSGLITAYELAKAGLDVEIYEKDEILGGMAKSKYINKIPTEHSWRGFMSNYFNIFDLFKKLPLNLGLTREQVKEHKYVIYKNNVYDISHFIKDHPGGSLINFGLGNDIEEVWNKYFVSWHSKNPKVIEALTKNKIGELVKSSYDTLVPLEMISLYNDISNNKPKLSFVDTIYLGYIYLKYLFSNKRKCQFYETRLFDVVNLSKISKLGYDFIVKCLTGPGLGLDYNNASIGHILFYIHGYLKTPGKVKWYITDRPSNDAIINPLINELKRFGVKIHYNSTYKHLIIEQNKITGILIDDKIVKANDYVIAINPNNLSFENNIKITNNQISFRLGFNNKLILPKNGFVLMDSKFNITFYPQDQFFSELNLNTLWSGTCVQPVNDIYTFEEFKNEIVSQFIESNELQEIIKKLNNKIITKNDINYIEIYDEWQWNDKHFESKNKKWVNTFENDKNRPQQTTKYDNLYLTGGYTNTSFKIWSMESSCESAKIVANLILEKYKKPLCFLYNHDNINGIFSWLDDILYYNNMNSIIDVIIIIIIIIIILVLKKIKK